MTWRVWLRRSGAVEHRYVDAPTADGAVQKLPKRLRPFVSRIEPAGSAAYRGNDAA